LKHLLDAFPIGLHTSGGFLPGETLMSQRGLKLAHLSLRLLQRSFGMFACGSLSSDCLSSRIERIAVTIRLMLAPLNDFNRHLAIANKFPSIRKAIDW
jgi:hypothetical protein